MRRYRSSVFALRAEAALYRFRESLFLLPGLIVLAGIALAELTAAADRAVVFPLMSPMSSNAATWLLATVAGATITTAGVVLSLTVVSLQLASSQFSPRVMRSFIRDRLSQTVIGLLAATFIYCVLILRHVSGEATAPAPALSMTVAVGLTVVTVLLIVAHLDHLAHGLQVGEVVRSIAEEGESMLARMSEQSKADRVEHRVPPTQRDCFDFVVPAGRDGWVTGTVAERMLAAVSPGTAIRLETRIGAYIHQGEALAVLSPAPTEPDKVIRRLSAALLISSTRTMQEDFDFAIRQLVDVALRALSPAINDPNTATEATLRLGSLLRRLLITDLPAESVSDHQGRTLVRPWELRHDEYIDHAFDPLRQAALPQVQVIAALLRVLRMLVVHVEVRGRPEHIPALERQIQHLLEAVANSDELHPHDRARLQEIAEATTDPADHGDGFR